MSTAKETTIDIIELKNTQGDGRTPSVSTSFVVHDRRDPPLDRCSKAFQDKYHALCEVLKNKPEGLFHDLLKDLQKAAESEGCNILHPLDVEEEVTNEELPPHRMTLLAYSIYYQNLEAYSLLMDNGASVACNEQAGSVLFQAMAHCHTKMWSSCRSYHKATAPAHANPESTGCNGCCHTCTGEHNHNEVIADCCDYPYKMKDCCEQRNVHNDDVEQFSCTAILRRLHFCCYKRAPVGTRYEQFDDNAIELFIQTFCGQKLKKRPNEVRDHDYEQFPDLPSFTCGGSYPFNICYMAFSLRQTQNTKFLIRIGADFVEANSNGLPSYLLEYCKSGKPDYLSWLFSVLSTSNLTKLIMHITDDKRIETWSNCKSHFGRNPVHALLLSGNEHVTREILGSQHKCNLLSEVDQNQRTALHIAAEMGLEESVQTIIEMGGNVTKCDKNRETPLTIAARNKHYGVVKYILGHLMDRIKTDRGVESFILEQLEQIKLTSSSVDDPMAIFRPRSEQFSAVQTALSVVAECGNREAMKAIADRFGVDPTPDLISCAIRSGDESVVALVDSLCVEQVAYNRIDGLLEACWLEFPAIRNFLYNKISTEQKKEALYLACARGNSIALEFLLSKKVNPNQSRQQIIIFCAMWFMNACHEIKSKRTPLLIAAERGHDGCIVQLLEAKAKPSVSDHRGYNCLMIAIERKHESVVKAILEQPTSLVRKIFDTRAKVEGSLVGLTYLTPLRMLIKDMPELAKQFLDSCVSERFGKGTREYVYEFEYIDDFEKVSGDLQNNILQKRGQSTKNHVISWMIQNKRLELLKHALVSGWIEQKWKRAQIFYFIMIVLYCVLLGALTAFVSVSPRPADNPACIYAYLAVENRSSSCFDSFGNTTSDGISVKGLFLYASGVIAMILSMGFLVLEFGQMIQLRVYYLHVQEWQNYLQLFVFFGTVAFISAQFNAGLNHCWCASEGIWQLGAAVIMCCWCNFIVILKDYPFLGIGDHITLLVNTCGRYLKLVYLPILLMASFGFSFYMLFAFAAAEGDSPQAFSTQWRALASTFFGTTGFDSIFVGTPIAYPAMGIILFIIFYVVVTVLFTNMLIGLSTSDALEALKEAKLISIANQVKFILSMDDAFPCLKKNTKRHKSDGGDSESTELQIADYWSQQNEWKMYKQRARGELQSVQSNHAGSTS